MKIIKYLIIGNGIAGLTAAKEIRKKDKESSITIISTENSLTYYRIRLTEALEKGLEKDKLIINDKKWYMDNNIEIRLGKKVIRIDDKDNKIILDNKEIIGYEKLLISTGGRSFIPQIEGIEKKGVFSLRTTENLEEIRDYMKDKQNIVVIGGGLLGLEVAWALREQGKNVSILESHTHVLSRQLDEEVGKMLEENLKDNGIDIFIQGLTNKIMGSTHVETIELDDGNTLKADMILISTGIRPNIDIAEGTSIKVNKGIIVDENLKTNIDNIYAAGDVAECNNTLVGLWTTSMEQGKIAGLNMTEENMEYNGIKPFTTLSIGDTKVFSAGNISEYDDIYSVSESDGQYKKIFIKRNKIIGGILFGSIKEMNSLKQAIFSNKTLDEYLNYTF